MPLRTAAGLGLGAAVLWLSLLVLLPLAAVVVKATGNGWSGFWDALTTREALWPFASRYSAPSASLP